MTIDNETPASAARETEHDGRAWTVSIAVVSIAIILVATLVGRAFTAIGAGQFDSRLFLYIGQQWADGLMPYRDLWENKPPGIFLITRLAQAASSPAMFIAVVEGAVVIGTATCTWFLLRLLGCGTLARWFGAVSIALCLSPSAMNEGDIPTGLLLTLPATASALCFLYADRWSRGAAIPALLGGVLCGMAVLLKTPGLAVLLAYSVVVAFAMLIQRTLTIRAALLRLSLAWVGCALVFMWPLMYFASHGVAGEFFDAMFTYNSHYGQATRPNPLKSALSLFGEAQPIATVLGLALVTAFVTAYGAIRSVIARVRPSANNTRIDVAAPGVSPVVFLTLWLAADLAGAMAGGRSYPHYLLAAVPSATILAALMIDYVARNAPGKRQLPAILVACAIAPLLAGLVADVRLFRDMTSSPPPRYWHGAARAVAEVACPNDRLFTWEYVPGIAQTTNLRPATIISSGHYLDDSQYSFDKFGNRVRTDLGTNPPEFLVVKAVPEPRHLLREQTRNHRAFVVELARSRYDTLFTQENGSGIVVYVRKGHACDT